MQTLSDYFENSDNKRRIQTVDFKKGELILGPNHDTKYMHVIQSGLVKIYGFDSRNNEYLAVIYGPGDIFPLAWIIDRNRPSVNFQALNDCRITLIPQKVFEESLNIDEKLRGAFLKRIVEQFALFATSINNLGLKYGRERVCYRLLLMAVRFGERKNGVTLIPHINQADFALTVKMTRESTSKEIAWLERQGVLEFDRTHMIIKDLEFLQNQVGKGVPVIFFDNI
jgi:CRP-like cAMP-binding protein